MGSEVGRGLDLKPAVISEFLDSKSAIVGAGRLMRKPWKQLTFSRLQSGAAPLKSISRLKMTLR
jgi:hypothetical protein